MSVIRAENLDVGKIEFSDLKKKDDGPKRVFISYEGKPLTIQLSNVTVPFGLSVYNSKDKNDRSPQTVIDLNNINSNIKYSLDFSLQNNEDFVDVLRDLDDLIIETITKNSKEWIGNTMDEAVVRAATYSSQLRKSESEDESSPYRFKVKCPFWKGVPGFKVFNKNKQEVVFHHKVDPNTINLDWGWAQKGMEVAAIATCQCLWIINKNVYCTWNLNMIRIDRESNRISDYAFLDDNGVEDDEEYVEDDE